MIPDYLLVSWALDVVDFLTRYWYACSALSMLLWLIFTFRIGTVHILNLEDIMPDEEREEE